MADDGTVNSQITDSVTQVVSLLTGEAPSQSMGMLDTVLLETLGMAMHNAVSRQQHSHMTSAAAVTAACARMLQARPPGPPPPPPPKPPVVHPVPSPGGVAVDIARNTAEAERSVEALRRDAATSGAETAAVQAGLDAIAKAASKPLSPPPPPPAPKP